MAFQLNRDVLIHYTQGQADAASSRRPRQMAFEVVEDYKPGEFLRCRLSNPVSRRGRRDGSLIEQDCRRTQPVRIVEPNFRASIPRPPGPAPARVAAAADLRAVAPPRVAAADPSQRSLFFQALGHGQLPCCWMHGA